MNLARTPLITLWIASSGCQDSAALSVSAGAAVEVDTYCDNGGCDDAAELDVELTVDADNNPNATVQVLQYRVDYELSGVDGVMPYFAARTDLNVAPGASTAFRLTVAGARQRDWALDQIGFGQADGTGTIALAGYNNDDELVEAEATFDIRFGDISAGSDKDAGTEMDGGI